MATLVSIYGTTLKHPAPARNCTRLSFANMSSLCVALRLSFSANQSMSCSSNGHLEQWRGAVAALCFLIKIHSEHQRSSHFRISQKSRSVGFPNAFCSFQRVHSPQDTSAHCSEWRRRRHGTTIGRRSTRRRRGRRALGTRSPVRPESRLAEPLNSLTRLIGMSSQRLRPSQTSY